MVVATPCPLILATPIAIMSGIDLAARNGIIAKSGTAIEQLGEVDIAVFDKTGTLTLGRPKVTAIVLAEQEKQRVLAVEDGHEMCRTPPSTTRTRFCAWPLRSSSFPHISWRAPWWRQRRNAHSHSVQRTA